MRRLSIFISYASAQKKFAGDLRSWFVDLAGIETFIAHNDINGGEEWQDVILEHIKCADLFICILSEEYRSSSFCDQELGIALALNKKIIPIKYNLTPYGFIQHIQAFLPKIDEPNCIEILFYKIISGLLGSPDSDVVDYTINSLIHKLNDSTSYDMSNKIASILMQHTPKLREQHTKAILRANALNNQVSHAFTMGSLINVLTHSN